MTTVRTDRLYDEDFFAWTQLQTKELRRFSRSRPNLTLDIRHIAEEIADLGKERRDSLRTWTAHHRASAPARALPGQGSPGPAGSTKS